MVASSFVRRPPKDHHRRGRWTPRATGRVGTAVAAAVAFTAVIVAAIATSSVVAAALVGSPRQSVANGRPFSLPAPTVRDLELAGIGNVLYQLRWVTNGSTCPETIFIGANTPAPGVPATDARLFPGNSIREASSECAGGGLLAVTVPALLGSSDIMNRLGEPDISERLSQDEWSRKLLRWASIVGLRMNSWKCSGWKPWPTTVVAYFGDSATTITDSDEGTTTSLPEGQKHILLATSIKMHCIYSGQASRASSGGGGGLSKGAIIGISIAAVLAVTAAAAAIVVVVVWRKRNFGAAGAQGKSNDEEKDDAPPPTPSPHSSPSPSKVGVEAAVTGHPGGVAAAGDPSANFASTVAPPAYPEGVGAVKPPPAAGGKPTAEPVADRLAQLASSIESPNPLTPSIDTWSPAATGGSLTAAESVKGGSGGTGLSGIGGNDSSGPRGKDGKGSGCDGFRDDGSCFVDVSLTSAPSMPDVLLSHA